MQIPSPTTSSEKMILLGEYHLGALRQTPSTRSIGIGFQPVQDELKLRKATREEAELAMVLPRVMLRFTERTVEQLIRAAVLAAQTLDGVRDGGAAKSAIAPDGVDAITRPRGAAQMVTLDAFLRRLLAQPAAAPLLAVHRPLLEAGKTAFQDALSARALAATQLAEARAQEDGAREAWVSAYSGDAGAIQTIFPRSRADRELYFDRFRSSSVGDDDEGGEEGGPPGGG